MKKVEEIVGNKLIEMAQYVLLKLIKPDMTLENINDIDLRTIDRFKRKYGIEAIIVDVDKTIRKSTSKDIPKVNKAWIKKLKGKIKIMFLSNGIDRDIEEYLKLQGIDYIGFACKPLKKNFKKACERMKVDPDKVLVVGNSIIGDIYGGKRSNMKTALVKKVENRSR